MIDNESEPGSYARHLRHTKDMNMGKMSRDKGANFEREMVNLAKEYRVKAQRVPLSGATNYAKGDIELEPWFLLDPLVGECKRRAKLPKFPFSELEGFDFVAVRGDREEALVIIRAAFFMELLQ